MTTGALAWTTSPAGRAVVGSLRPRIGRGARAADGADHELVSLDDLDRACVGAEQGRRLVGDLVEDRPRVELGREQAAHARELLGEGSRRSFALVELAPLETPSRGARQAATQLEVVVGERALLGEEDDDEPAFFAPRRVDRDREQRADAGEAPPILAEPLVVVERGRGEEPALAGGGLERRRRPRHAVGERRREFVRNPVGGSELEAACAGHQDRGEGPAQRLVRRMGDRVERGRVRQVLGERRGDPVEAALDPRLANALLEARGVSHGERGQPGERLEEVRLELAELAVGVTRRHAEQPSALPGPGHRCGDRARETLVCRVRERLAEAALHLALGRELELDELRVEPVDGCAAEHRALGVVEVAVGRIGVEQLRHLDDESLEHGLQPQLARHDLGRLEQRRLLLEPLAFSSRSWAACMATPSSLATASATRTSASDQAAGSERWKPSTPIIRSKTRIGVASTASVSRSSRVLIPPSSGSSSSGSVADVVDGHRAPFARGEVGDRKPVCDRVDRDEALGVPLGAIGIEPARLAKP